MRWQVLLLLLPTATCGLLHTNEGAQVSAADPEGSQVTSGSIVWALSFVYLAWVLGVPRQDLVPFVAGAAFIMLPDVEGARTRRSARLSLTAEERTASYVLAAVPVYIWIVLSFVYRLRRQAALALRKRALSCFQRHLAQSKLLADARAIIATRALVPHPPRALPLEIGCDKNGVLLQRDGHGIVRICSARHGFNQDGSHTAPTFPVQDLLEAEPQQQACMCRAEAVRRPRGEGRGTRPPHEVSMSAYTRRPGAGAPERSQKA